MILRKFLARKKLIFLVIVLAVLLPYFSILNNQFAYDDNDFFVNWETVRSLRNLPALIGGDLPLSHQHVYRPVRSVIQAVAYQLFGPNPLGYHGLSLVIYIAIVWLVFLIISKLFRRPVALVAALFFAVLPIHVEAITFITASFDGVGILLMLAAFYLYLNFSDAKNKKIFYFSLSLSLLAFFTYEFALVLPFLIVWHEVCFKDAGIKVSRWSKRIWWYFGLAALYFLIRTVVLAKVGAPSLLTDLGLKTRVLTTIKAFAENFWLVIFNFPLSVNHPMAAAGSFAEGRVILSLIILAALVVLAIVLYRRRQRAGAFVIGWFLIGLLPTVNAVRVSRFVAERYLFISSLAWAMLLGMVFYGAWLAAKRKDYKIIQGAVVIIFLALILFYGVATFNRNSDWQSDESLWQSTLADEKNDTRSFNNLAFAARQKGEYEKAIEYLNQAVKVNPDYYLAYENLGEIYSELGQQEKAIENFNRAVQLEPDYFAAYNNRGFAYYLLNQKESAKADYLKAIELDPDYYQANLNLGALYFEENDFERAIACFEKAIKTNRRNGEIYEALGLAYSKTGRLAAAKEAFTQALKLNPNSVRARQLLDELK